MSRHPTGLKIKTRVDEPSCGVNSHQNGGRLDSIAMYEVSLDEEPLRLKSAAMSEGVTPDGINSYVSVIKKSFKVGGHELWFDLKWDMVNQVLHVNEAEVTL